MNFKQVQYRDRNLGSTRTLGTGLAGLFILYRKICGNFFAHYRPIIILYVVENCNTNPYGLKYEVSLSQNSLNDRIHILNDTVILRRF